MHRISARTGTGGAAYDPGNQKNNGKMPPLIPNTIRNNTAMTVTIPGCPISAIFTEISAIFSVPTTEYK